MVGTTSKLEGEIEKFTVDLFKTLLDTSSPITQEIRQIVDFYHEILQEESRSDKDLEYWIDYVVSHGGTGHLSPKYANKSLLEYYDVISLLAIAFFTMISLCSGCNCFKKKQ